MNISSPLGFVVGFAVLAFGLLVGIKSPLIFVNVHAIVIVVGGTLATALICFPLRHFVNMVSLYFRTLFRKVDQETRSLIQEIVRVAEAVSNGRDVDSAADTAQNLFLKESLKLVAQEGLSDAELSEVLEKRVELQYDRYRAEGQTYKILGKFPPAFGLVGTTLGMIALLQGLGEPNAFESIGPAMSTALVATFYGLILANFFIIPIGENISQASQADLVMRRLVIDGVRLIKERKHPLLVEEYLKSYLTPLERNKYGGRRR